MKNFLKKNTLYIQSKKYSVKHEKNGLEYLAYAQRVFTLNTQSKTNKKKVFIRNTINTLYTKRNGQKSFLLLVHRVNTLAGKSIGYDAYTEFKL